MQKIAYIVGQGGSGKSALVRCFNERPLTGWTFIDFDIGGLEKPETTDLGSLGEWVKEQRKFWLQEIESNKYSDTNIALFGVGLFPWKIPNPDKAAFAYLDVDQDKRKERLISRGDPHLWEAYQKDIMDITRRLKEADVKRIDNSDRPVEETAAEIRDWLLSL